MKLLKKTLYMFNYIIIIFIILFIIKYIFIFLHSYTSHDNYIKVPNIKYYNNIHTIKKIMTKLNLKYKIGFFYYNINSKYYNLFECFPLPGSFIKPNRLININKNIKYCNNKIPYTHINYNNNKNIFKYFHINKIIYIPFSKKNIIINVLYKNNILKFNNKIPKYSGIDIIKGQGYILKKIIPNYLHKSLIKINSINKKYNFFINIIYSSNILINYINRIITYQIPCYGYVYNNNFNVNILNNYNKKIFIIRNIIFNKNYDVIYNYKALLS